MAETVSRLLALLDEYGRRLHVLLTKITLREEAAEELLQELFLKLHQSGGFAEADHPERYLFRTAIHLAFDWHARQKKLANVGPLSGKETGLQPDPSNQIEQREQLQLVIQAVEQLPAADREIVVLRFLHGSSYEELAEQFGSTPHRIRALCAKAVARLRKQLVPGEISEGKDER